MGSLKTLLVLLLLLPTPLSAAMDTLSSTFAACTGRLSAELEHSWLVEVDNSDEIAHRRLQFIELLNATVAPDLRRQALYLRIDAKMAHAQLLTAATFSKDADRATWALKRARSEIDYCLGFLLDS